MVNEALGSSVQLWMSLGSWRCVESMAVNKTLRSRLTHCAQLSPAQADMWQCALPGEVSLGCESYNNTGGVRAVN